MERSRSERLAVGVASERLVLLTLTSAMFIYQTSVVIITPLVADIGDTFGVSIGVAGQVRTASALVAAVAAPLIGLRSERTGRRAPLIAGFCLVALATLGSALAPTFALLLVVQAAGGLGIAALLSMGYAAVGDYFPPQRRSWAMGIVNVGQPLAWVLAVPLIGLVADGAGWRWSFAGVPFLFSLAALGVALRLPRSGQAPERAVVPVAGAAALRWLVGSRSAATWVGAELLGFVGWAASLTFVGAYFIETFGLSAGTVGPLLALLGLANVAGSLLADRVTRRSRAQTTILASATTSALLLAIAWGLPVGIGAAVLLLVGYTFAQGVRGTTSTVLGLRQSTEYRGTMMALRATVMQLGYVLGAVGVGLLLGHGGYRGASLFCAAVITVGAILTFLLVDG